MRRVALVALACCTLVTLVLVLTVVGQASRPGVAAAADPPKTTKNDITKWMTELSNWGRWGKTDQIGTLNLITPEKRKAAMKLARDGVSVSLAHTLDKEQFPDNPRPLGQQMTIDNTGHAMDLYTIWYHGSTITHIDSLCHYSFEGKIYDGYPRSDIAQGPGCPMNGVENQRAGIMTRGVIVDLPRLKNVPYLEPGTPVYPSDLEAWENPPGSRSVPATPSSCARDAGCSERRRARGTSRRIRPAGTRR